LRFAFSCDSFCGIFLARQAEKFYLCNDFSFPQNSRTNSLDRVRFLVTTELGTPLGETTRQPADCRYPVAIGPSGVAEKGTGCANGGARALPLVDSGFRRQMPKKFPKLLDMKPCTL